MIGKLSRRMEFKALREWNKRNVHYWEGVRASENRQAINPLYYDPSLLRKTVLTDLAAKGGRAQKADRLTLLVRRIVDERRDISEKQLRKALVGEPGIEFLDSNDDVTRCLEKAVQIRFLDRRGREKEIPIARLKDRLSRAKTFRAKRIARQP
jgi:hypothetical protein